MIGERLKRTVPAVACAVLALAAPAIARAAGAPVKLELASRYGFKVNASTEGNICNIEPGVSCRAAEASALPGGFTFPSGAAVDNDPASPDYGDVYVADTVNHRVQELTASGAFVRMFGREVNATTKGDVCTAASGNTCQAGLQGAAAGQFFEPTAIAVDPETGNVYLTETVSGGGNRESGARVQEFTAEGRFVQEIGRDVNAASEGNLCSEEEIEKAGVKCTGPALHALGSETEVLEPGAFQEPVAVAVGGPEHLVYVGDEHRVQELEADGKYKREIALTSISPAPGEKVVTLSVDQATGALYLVYQEGNQDLGNVIRKFNQAGEEVRDGHYPVTLAPRDGERIVIVGIALDASGRLAASEIETKKNVFEGDGFFGSLLDGATGRLITEFARPEGEFARPEGGPNDLTFDTSSDELYGVATASQEILAYRPLPVAELLTGASSCEAGAERGTDATFSCVLGGEANAWGVAGTEAWFQWGATPALGSATVKQSVVEVEPDRPVAVQATLAGLLPDETYYYREAGEDSNVRAPELLSGEPMSLRTGIVAPRVLGSPSAPVVGVSSAVLLAELNPEHTSTTYEFQYGSCSGFQACPGIAQLPETLNTSPVQSNAYGSIGTSVEISGLQPATTYEYRLIVSSQGGEAAGETGSFTTGPAPVVSAQTEGAGAIAATSAVIAGSVNPDGQAASYAFELGIDNGAGTQFGVVLSGQAGAGSAPVGESLALTGLQPGTTYAYRIAVHSGDGSGAGQSATGATATFTTAGLPAVLGSPAPLAILATPNITFPAASTPGAPSGKTKRAAKHKHKHKHAGGRKHKRKLHRSKK